MTLVLIIGSYTRLTIYTLFNVVGCSPQDQTLPTSMHNLDFEGVGIHVHPLRIISGEACSPVQVKYLTWSTSNRAGVADSYGLFGGNSGRRFFTAVGTLSMTDHVIGTRFSGRLG
jgi:hypothetical protein